MSRNVGPHRERSYRIVQHGETYRVEDGAEPHRLIAVIERRLDRRNQPIGWRFRPETVMSGPRTKLWDSPEEALVGFKLMTKGKARDAVAAAEQQPLPK